MKASLPGKKHNFLFRSRSLAYLYKHPNIWVELHTTITFPSVTNSKMNQSPAIAFPKGDIVFFPSTAEGNIFD